MKSLLFMFAMIIASLQLFAQQPARSRPAPVIPPPLPLREISGVVKDTTGQGVAGATVFLKSTVDSIKIATNEDGIFVIKNVKMATFLITVSAVGYKPVTRRFLQNDAVKRLVLDPIVMQGENTLIKEVIINGTPSIIYKTDTVEYRASDYKVRENATIDELLKKMEGMEVGNDGSLTFQGQSVTKAKLNGKEFAGGDVPQAIQNLPADIVENIQIVDDYGDQAARTGVKDGDPQKILNITTRADKSVGLTSRTVLQAGSNDRYNGQLSILRINANQQISLIGRVQNTVTGIASSGADGGGRGPGATGGSSGGGNPGTRLTASPSFSYRDTWAPNLEVLGSYNYNYNDNNSRSASNGVTYSSRGNGEFIRSGTSNSTSKGHTASFRVDWDINKRNYLQITPTYSYTGSISNSSSLSDVVNYYNPTQHQITSTLNNSTSTRSNYGVTVLYQHIFAKQGRNISIQTSINKSDSRSDRDANNRYRFYLDETQNFLKKDSIPHTLVSTTNINTTYRTSVTYVEPLSKTSRLEVNTQMRRSNNDNVAITDTVYADGHTIQLYKLDNIFNYTITEYRSSLNFRYTGTKYNLLFGVQAIPMQLNGTKINAGNGTDVHTSQSYFMVSPRLTFNYAWSRTERLDVIYNTSSNEPNFQQIQPFADRTNPNNVIIGNPDLKPSLTNSLNLRYNNYLANSKFNFSVNLTGSFITNQVTTNTSQVETLIIPNDPTSGKKSINETTYININGSHNISGTYNISKQLNDRKYNLSLNGGVTYGYNNAFSNSIAYHTTSWNFNQRFGPRLQPTENIEINPYFSYFLNRQYSTTLNAKATTLQTTSLAIDGRFYFLKTWQVNYSASKNYVTGVAAQTTNPLVINAGFEKEFGRKRFITFTFNVYDIFHQNFFIQQTVTSTGVTNTLSNTLSRYFMAGIRLNFQKWSGRPMRNGIPQARRGDGSFIVN